MRRGLISVVVPTFRRPLGFTRAARSVFAQRGQGAAIELIGVDNDPDGSALSTFSALAREASIPFFWTHEPTAGVASARNAGVALARGDLIAFLDDDEEAPPHWLAALAAVQAATGADVVFGPVQAVTPPADAWRESYFKALFSRVGPAESGPIAQAFGTGNSLLVRARTLLGPAPFDVAANATGGEDDRLFAQVRARGGTFAWAAEALVYEHVPPERARFAYALRRAFAYGQGPCEAAFAARPVRWDAIAWHMGVGAAQAGFHGLLAAAAWAVRDRRRAFLLDKAVRGLGKVWWFQPQRFYGVAAAAKPSRAGERRAPARVPVG